MAVTISPCLKKKELRLFERVPELIHRQDRYFVPPFPGSISKIFSPKAPYAKNGEMLPFIAYRDGRPVGRIAAMVNRRHNEWHKDKVGFFGFFDSIDDTEVAEALFDRARQELKARGMEAVRGPYNPDLECGVLTEGFESIPFILMPYNPPYYLDLYEKAGMKPARDLYAFYISANVTAPERIEKICARVRRTTGVTIRPVDLKRLSEELKIIQELWNVTMDRNWSFVPLTYEDFEFIADDLKQIIEPNMVMIAEKDGVPIGFSLTLPNINEVIWRAKGSKGILRILKVVWYMLTSHPKEARLALLGVKPEYRNKGIAALFYQETLMRGKKKYVGGELSWVEADNTEIINAISVMGGQKYKSYRIFETPLVQRQQSDTTTQ